MSMQTKRGYQHVTMLEIDILHTLPSLQGMIDSKIPKELRNKFHCAYANKLSHSDSISCKCNFI